MNFTNKTKYVFSLTCLPAFRQPFWSSFPSYRCTPLELLWHIPKDLQHLETFKPPETCFRFVPESVRRALWSTCVYPGEQERRATGKWYPDSGVSGHIRWISSVESRGNVPLQHMYLCTFFECQCSAVMQPLSVIHRRLHLRVQNNYATSFLNAGLAGSTK